MRLLKKYALNKHVRLLTRLYASISSFELCHRGLSIMCK